MKYPGRYSGTIDRVFRHGAIGFIENIKPFGKHTEALPLPEELLVHARNARSLAQHDLPRGVGITFVIRENALEPGKFEAVEVLPLAPRIRGQIIRANAEGTFGFVGQSSMRFETEGLPEGYVLPQWDAFLNHFHLEGSPPPRLSTGLWVSCIVLELTTGKHAGTLRAFKARIIA